MRCLVTGAEGFIGANLCQLLNDRGHEVTASSLHRRGHTSLDALGVDVRVEYGDVTDAAYVERLVNESEADWVFHLAAVSIVRQAHYSPALALRTNILGTLNIVEACSRAEHVRACVCASSDKAYGDHGDIEYTEETPLLPTGPYEVSKACADHIARLYGQFGTVAVVRSCNVFGPADLNFSRLVPNACRLALRGEAPVIHGAAGNTAREWIDVDSVARAYLCIAQSGEGGAFNVGSGYSATAFRLAQMISNYADSPPPVFGEEPPCYEIPAQRTNSERLRALGWESRLPLCGPLAETVDWYRDYLGARVMLCVS